MASLLGQDFVAAAAANAGDSQGWGGEVELKGNSGGFRWDLSYSYSQVSDGPEFTAENFLSFAHSAPNHHARALIGYTTGAWSFDLNLQYLSGTSMLRSADGGATAYFAPVGAYGTVSGRIAYDLLDNLTLAVSGTNLQSARQQNSPYPELERQVLVSLTKRF